MPFEPQQPRQRVQWESDSDDEWESDFAPEKEETEFEEVLKKDPNGTKDLAIRIRGFSPAGGSERGGRRPMRPRWGGMGGPSGRFGWIWVP